jgi:hypothetical protein
MGMRQKPSPDSRENGISRKATGGFSMSIHRGYGSSGPGSSFSQITTTLFELMESMDEQSASPHDAWKPGAGKTRPEPAQDRMIARKVAGMFLSGRIRFKRPGDIRNTYPEWVV